MKYWIFNLKLFVIFFIGSVFGCIIETLYSIVKTGGIKIRKGLIYGPFIPVYGIGAIMFYFILSVIKKPLSVFIICVIMGGFLEFACSLFQEKIFGSISWDYSDTFFNLDGRTNLQYSIYWGIIGLVFSKILPLFKKIDLIIYSSQHRIVIYILMAYMLVDIVISCLACLRQYKRLNKIKAQNRLDVFLDKHYPDELLDKIYNNKIWVENSKIISPLL